MSVNNIQFQLNAPMDHSASPDWLAARRGFIEAGGHTTQSFGLGRIVGQIYALLYLNPAPLCLDEIAAELGVSKASVSTIIRQLERWTAVKRVWVKGDRRDYYEAETDFQAVLKHGLLAAMRKKLETAGAHIDTIEHCLKAARADGRAGTVPTRRLTSWRIAWSRRNGFGIG